MVSRYAMFLFEQIRILTLLSILLGSVVAVVGMPLTVLVARKNLELVRSLFCFEAASDLSGIS